MVGVIGSSASGNEEKIFEQILEFIQKQENLDGYFGLAEYTVTSLW